MVAASDDYSLRKFSRLSVIRCISVANDSFSSSVKPRKEVLQYFSMAENAFSCAKAPFSVISTHWLRRSDGFDTRRTSPRASKRVSVREMLLLS